jgi:trafficking protein particle complex subunit 6
MVPFDSQIDKLQTNHRGVFVLSDFKFKWLEKYASDDDVSKETAARMLHFPCGILRGALANLGLSSIVVAEFTTLPACTFNIKIKSV